METMLGMRGGENERRCCIEASMMYTSCSNVLSWWISDLQSPKASSTRCIFEQCCGVWQSYSELREVIAVRSHGMSVFRDPWKRPASGFDRYSLGPGFKLSTSKNGKQGRNEGIAWYMLAETLLADWAKKPRNLKNGRYRVLLDTRLGRFTAAEHLAVLYAHKSLIPKTGSAFLIIWTGYLSQMVHNELDHRSRKNPRYFVIANGTERSTIWVAPGDQNQVS